jgi:hypothetical protein
MRYVKVAGVLLVALVAVSACGDDVKDAANDKSGSSNVIKGDSTTSTTVEKAKKPKLEIADYGFSQLPPDSIGESYLTYAVIVKNNSTDQIVDSADVNIAFYNAAGTVVKSESDTLTFIMPGSTVASTPLGGVNVAGVTRMEVQLLPGDETETVNARPIPTLTAEGVNTTADDYFMRTNATLRSTFSKDLKSLSVAAVYRDAARKIIGGASTFADFVPAGGTAAVEISASNVLPVASTDVYVSISNLTALDLAR